MLRTLAKAPVRSEADAPDFRFIDLFAGIGGMRLAARLAGGHCVFSCERDKFSRQTYEANFKDGPNHPFPRDIRSVVHRRFRPMNCCWPASRVSHFDRWCLQEERAW